MTEPPPKYQTEHRRRYHDWLRSIEWQRLREAVMRRAGYTCECCLQRPAMEVHHVDYTHGLYTPAWKLRAVCTVCHDRLTAIQNDDLDVWDRDFELPY